MKKRRIFLSAILTLMLLFSSFALPAKAKNLQSWDKKIDNANQRFKLVLDGEAVLDSETQLVWEQSPNTTERSWEWAVYYCYTEIIGGRQGWRLPTVEELASLLDQGYLLPSGHPFNVQFPYRTWTATTYQDKDWLAYRILFYAEIPHIPHPEPIMSGVKNLQDYAPWCVRGGQGYNGY